MPILKVPYFPQPDNVHCQATCMKMMSTYLDSLLGRPRSDRDIFSIKTTINSSANRPDKRFKNSWTNMKWWLDGEFKGKFRFELYQKSDAAESHRRIVESIRQKLPAMLSTQHGTINGHVILAVGVVTEIGSNIYSDAVADGSRDSCVYVCHDPYGASDPAGRQSLRYGKRRFEGGMTYVDPGMGAAGPGRNVYYPPDNIQKVIKIDGSPQTFYILITPKRLAA